MLCLVFVGCFCFQAEDGIRDLVRSRGLGDVYKRQRSSRSTALRWTGRRSTAARVAASSVLQSRMSSGLLSLTHI